MSAFLSKVRDVGDLPVQVLSFGFGNWVLKAEIERPVKQYVGDRPTFFYVFLNLKNMTFYVFWVVADVFSNTEGRREDGKDEGKRIPQFQAE